MDFRSLAQEGQDFSNKCSEIPDMPQSKSFSRNHITAISVIVLLAGLLSLGVGFGVGLSHIEETNCGVATAPTTTTPSPSSIFIEGKYKYAAVAAEGKPCTSIGVEILAREHGSATDAAIATILCVCVINIESCGIGGGHFMTIYNRANQSARVIMAREMAPSTAHEEMFVPENVSSTLGGMAIGIPGDIKGMWEAWKLNGRVSWSRLFQPTIKLCREGFLVSPALARRIQWEKNLYGTYTELRSIVTNPATGELYTEGERIFLPKLAHTLETIAREGPDAFYFGELSRNISLDIMEAGGIISPADLANYKVLVKESVSMTADDGSKYFVPPPPSSGVVYLMILNILQGYHFDPNSLNEENAVLTWHRIVEAFKFAYSKRSLLGDADAEDETFREKLDSLLKNMTSPDYGSYIRSLISDDRTHPVEYYEPAFDVQEDHGTCHISVLAANGDAVSCTSTINLGFGSKVVGKRTGIIFNNEMDDFSTPNTRNMYGVPASPANFIKPWKRPLSSMSPAIVADANGDVQLVTGASGGTLIITATALNTLETLFFGMGIKEAIDYPRIHHQLSPDYIFVESGFPQKYLDGLKAKGHKIEKGNGSYSRVNAVLQRALGSITAYTDYRKHGGTDGY